MAASGANPCLCERIFLSACVGSVCFSWPFCHTNETALTLIQMQNTPYGYGFNDVVTHPETKAMVVTLRNNPANFSGPETFQVFGNGATQVGAGALPSNTQFNIETKLDVGFRVKSNSISQGRTAILAEVPGNDAKAMTVVNSAVPTSPKEVFRVGGDGITNIIGLAGTPQNTSQLYVETGLDVGCRVKLAYPNYASNKAAYLAEVPFLESKAISVVSTADRFINLGGPKEVFRVDGGGVAWMHEIRVRVTQFPDYVFEDGYELMELDSLERYVHENHRLPGMPSAKEIEENDANLGELVRLQQEKIEELTLYLIELSKEQHIQNGREK